MGGVRPEALDAVTLDAYGTIVGLDRHIERLRASLVDVGVHRHESDVERAFSAEVDFYTRHKCEARDAATLVRLRRECARVFVEALGADLDFTDAFVAAIVLRPLPGVMDALAQLRARGLALAVVSNWDCSLPDQLERAGIRVDAVFTCAGTGAAKPAPRIFELALERLGVEPARALHVGDAEEDERGAAAASLHFAPAPLMDLVAAWT